MDAAAHPALSHRGYRLLMAASSFPSHDNDWKSVFIRQLADALAESPELHLSLWAPWGTCDPKIHWATTRSDEQFLKDLMAQGGLAHLLRNQPVKGLITALQFILRLRRAISASEQDLLHLNWLQLSLSLAPNSPPAVITALGSDLALLRIPLVRSLIRNKIRERKCVICPNAEWMIPRLEAEFGDVAKIVYVPLGIEQGWYDIPRKQPGGPHRWLAVTRLTKDKLGPLLESGAALFNSPERELHLLGPMQEDLALPDWVHYHGAASPKELAEKWFPDATGLISLSTHAEGRPQVMLEAMAASLPIVASKIPAHSNFIVSSDTGYLTDDHASLEKAIRLLEMPEENQRISRNAKAWVKKHVGNWHDCASRYNRVYESLLTAEE